MFDLSLVRPSNITHYVAPWENELHTPALEGWNFSSDPHNLIFLTSCGLTCVSVTAQEAHPDTLTPPLASRQQPGAPSSRRLPGMPCQFLFLEQLIHFVPRQAFSTYVQP